jgi:hypothetical protein
MAPITLPRRGAFGSENRPYEKLPPFTRKGADGPPARHAFYSPCRSRTETGEDGGTLIPGFCSCSFRIRGGHRVMSLDP